MQYWQDRYEMLVCVIAGIDYVALSIIRMQTLNLDWRPLFRDAFVYGLSISIFIGFAWDGMFQWWEALILLLLYVGYIAIMKFNPYLMKLLAKIECKWCRYVLSGYMVGV